MEIGEDFLNPTIDNTSLIVCSCATDSSISLPVLMTRDSNSSTSVSMVTIPNLANLWGGVDLNRKFCFTKTGLYTLYFEISQDNRNSIFSLSAQMFLTYSWLESMLIIFIYCRRGYWLVYLTHMWLCGGGPSPREKAESVFRSVATSSMLRYQQAHMYLLPRYRPNPRDKVKKNGQWIFFSWYDPIVIFFTPRNVPF